MFTIREKPYKFYGENGGMPNKTLAKLIIEACWSSKDFT
jgi:hypothetical protein